MIPFIDFLARPNSFEYFFAGAGIGGFGEHRYDPVLDAFVFRTGFNNTLRTTSFEIHVDGVFELRSGKRLRAAYPFNMTGNPGASVPIGLSESGLPIGMQIVGGIAREETVLAAAAAYEQAHPWADLRPPTS